MSFENREYVAWLEKRLPPCPPLRRLIARCSHDGKPVLDGPVGKSSGNRNGRHRGHSRLVGILPWLAHLTKDEDRAVLNDL